MKMKKNITEKDIVDAIYLLAHFMERAVDAAHEMETLRQLKPFGIVDVGDYTNINGFNCMQSCGGIPHSIPQIVKWEDGYYIEMANIEDSNDKRGYSCDEDYSEPVTSLTNVQTWWLPLSYLTLDKKERKSWRDTKYTRAKDREMAHFAAIEKQKADNEKKDLALFKELQKKYGWK
jgi:hypothetical protein